jgi:hypothetical protein
VACDILWFYRNKAFHDGVSFNARSVSPHINKISLEHFQAWHSLSFVLVEKWIPPPLNWVKINFDIVIRDSFSAQAAVCHNSEGQILHMISHISSCSPNMGKALAAQLAISLASSLFLDCLILEGDSEVVLQALKHPNSTLDWRISPIIFESLDTIHFASSWEVRNINISANFYAHLVARWAATKSHSSSIPFFSPLLSILIL